MNGVTLAHPGPDQLGAFGIGELAPAEAAEVERHVSGCDTCCQTLWTVPDDQLVALLRTAIRMPEEEPAHGQEPTPEAAQAERAGTGIPPGLADHPRYRVEKLLGVGGMGVVYRAVHLLMERPVALKVIDRALTRKPAVVERFHREVKAAARLSHPNIVHAYDAEQAGDTHFLVMEFVEGTTLARVVEQRGPLPVAVACNYLRQAALGLQSAWEQGMVHRDIKPQNLMLTTQGQVKVLDFGLARLARQAAPASLVQAGESAPAPVAVLSLTQLGTVMGTPDYIAPEQATDAHAADTRADIYSLGCTLYFLLTGQVPFPADTVQDKLRAHAHHTPRPLTELRKDVPLGLARILERMMAKDPARRYQTPAEVAVALLPFTTAVRRPPRRRLWRLAAAALLAAAILAAGAVIYVKTDKGEFVIKAEGEVAIVVNSVGVKLQDRDTNREYQLKVGKHDLRSGDYEIDVSELPAGLEVSTKVFTLKRGKEVTVTVRAQSVAQAPLPLGEPKVEAPAAAGPARLTAPLPGAPSVTGSVSWPNTDVRRFAGHADTVSWPNTDVRRFAGHADTVESLAFSPDGRLLLSGNDDRTARLWDVATARELRVLAGHTGAVTGVAFSSDGRTALTGSKDATVRLWDVATGKELYRLAGHTGPVSGVAFSPAGSLALSGSSDGTARLWDTKTGKEARRFRGHMAPVWGVAFSPRGKFALSGGDDERLRLWDVATGKQVRSFPFAAGAGRGLAFTPDGQTAAAGGADGEVRLWDLQTGKELRRLGSHFGAVRSVAFSPDGRLLLTCDADRTMCIWEMATGRIMFRIATGESGIDAAVFSPDGRHVVFGGQDKVLHLFGVPPALLPQSPAVPAGKGSGTLPE